MYFSDSPLDRLIPVLVVIGALAVILAILLGVPWMIYVAYEHLRWVP